MNKIIRESTKRPITILTTATHERYQSCLAHLPYNFIMWNHGKAKKWHTEFAEVPDNYLYVNKLTPNLTFDAVLCQNKFIEYDLLRNVANKNQVPLIQLEHTVCPEGASYEYVNKMHKRQGDVNVFITDYSAQMWGFTNYEVVNHMVDTDLFVPKFTKEKDSAFLSVVNEYEGRDRECGFSVWKNGTKDILARLVGMSESGISQPANNTEELIRIYQNHLLFLNTSLVSPLPMSLLEAMSCGLCCVSTNTCDIPNVINDDNGVLYSPEDNLNKLLKEVLSYDVNTLLEIGQKARQTIIDNFSKDEFIKKWCKIIESSL